MNPKAKITITPTTLEPVELNFNDALQLICSALLQLMNNAVENFATTEEEKEQLTDSIYDGVNEATSQILQMFCPEKDPHPEANINEIMARQDLMIADEFSKLKATNPRLFKKRQKQLRRIQDEFAYKKALSTKKRTPAEKT
jgi:hypothetical protein